MKELNQLKKSEKITGAKARINVLETYNTALAQAYAVDGWKYYIEQLINLLVRDAALSSKDFEDLRFKQGKVAGLNDLLSKSKKAFEEYNKIQSFQKHEQIKSQEIDDNGNDIN